MPARIPIAQPSLTDLERNYVCDAVNSGHLSSGPYNDRFERNFAAHLGTTHCVACSSGTTALHLALLACGVGPGHEVILPSLTFVATANAVRYCGATPVFVDIDPATWCIDPEKAHDAITARTRAVIAVHAYGHPCDMGTLKLLLAGGRRINQEIFLIEDAAQALGGADHEQLCGTFGDIATFSFYGNKIITSGEGGALVTHDAFLAERARFLRGQAHSPQRRYWFPEVGYNYRLTNLQAALLCAQLERLPSLLEVRDRIYTDYRMYLADVPGITFQPRADHCRIAPWLHSVLIGPSYSRSRDSLIDCLAGEGIETRPFFVPLHHLPPYQSPSTPKLPHTDRIASQGINLPTYFDLSTSDIGRICDTIARLAQ